MTEVVTLRPHTRLSPSMMARVEACTASHFLAPDIQVRDANEYAARGTVAHELSERFLNDPLLMPYEVLGLSLEADGYMFEVDDDMVASFLPYVEYCQEIQQQTDEWEVEKRVSLPKDMTGEIGRISGLCDFAAHHVGKDADAVYEIVDLKTGRMPVFPDALQLALYGFMLIEELKASKTYTAPRKGQAILKTTIVQPASDEETIASALWFEEDMLKLEERIVALLDNIHNRVFYYGVGDHCRYCPVLSACTHVRAVAMDAAMLKAIPSPDLLASGAISGDDLDDMLAKLPLIKQFEKAIVDLADKYLHAGGNLTNAKLVRKRTIRKWKDKADPIPVLKKYGIDPYKPPALISPTEAEKRLPAGAYKSSVEPMVEKPVGDLTVAIGEDKRAAVQIADALRRAVEGAAAAKHVQHDAQKADRK